VYGRPLVANLVAYMQMTTYTSVNLPTYGENFITNPNTIEEVMAKTVST